MAKQTIKPQSPMYNGDAYILPLTTADQVIKSNGQKLEVNGNIDADTLGGKSSLAYVSKEEINEKMPFRFGIDENGNYGYIKDGADTVTPFIKNFYVTNSILDQGTFMGTTAKLTGQYNGSVGFSGTGTVNSLTTTSYIGWQYELDLTNYNYLVFCHQKVTNHGQPTVKIDNTTAYTKGYGNIDTNQHLYMVDISGYTGVHKVTFHCGYVDSSGSASSKSQFSNICFIGGYETVNWNS